MKIVLKTKNLTIRKFQNRLDGHGIIIPLDILIKDEILVDLIYVLDEDFHGINKNTPLWWIYNKHPYNGKWIYCLLIPLHENIGDANKVHHEKYLKLKELLKG